MASVGVLDEPMATDEAVPVWAYKPSEGIDESLRDAALVVGCDPSKLRLDENLKTFQIMCVSAEKGKETVRAEDTLSFDFVQQMVSFNIKNLSIPSSAIHFVYHGSSAASTNKLMISYQDGGKIRAVHFVTLEGELQLLLIINAFRRLLFEFFRPVCENADSAVTVVNKRVPSYVGEIQFTIKSKKAPPEVKEEPQSSCKYNVMMGWNFLSLYENQFSGTPSYILYFWDSPDFSVVEKVVMYNDTQTVKLETSDTSFEIPHANNQCPEFLRAIREMRPKPKDTFTDPKKLVQYITRKIDRIPAPFTDTRRPRRLDEPMSSMDVYRSDYSQDFTSDIVQQIRSFKDDMNVALTKFQDNDQIQLPWIVAETEINELIQSGFVPETDIASGGLDPNSMDHFLQCIREVEDHLTKQQYEMALSRLQGTRLIFSESSIPDMKDMVNDDDVTFMKKIYFHSFL